MKYITLGHRTMLTMNLEEFKQWMQDKTMYAKDSPGSYWWLVTPDKIREGWAIPLRNIVLADGLKLRPMDRLESYTNEMLDGKKYEHNPHGWYEVSYNYKNKLVYIQHKGANCLEGIHDEEREYRDNRWGYRCRACGKFRRSDE
jgi:hypothetical protein